MRLCGYRQRHCFLAMVKRHGIKTVTIPGMSGRYFALIDIIRVTEPKAGVSHPQMNWRRPARGCREKWALGELIRKYYPDLAPMLEARLPEEKPTAKQLAAWAKLRKPRAEAPPVPESDR
jgi:hypothetical protein